MPWIQWKLEDGGLWLRGPADAMPEGMLRRGAGLSRVRHGSLVSRAGSVKVLDTTAHSLYRFGGARWSGDGVNVRRDGVIVDSTQNGTPLAFVRGNPSPDATSQYLFAAGGGNLRKFEEDGTASNWGLPEAPDGAVATVAQQAGRQIDNFDANPTNYAATIGAVAFNAAAPTYEGAGHIRLTTTGGLCSVWDVFPASIDLSVDATGRAYSENAIFSIRTRGSMGWSLFTLTFFTNANRTEGFNLKLGGYESHEPVSNDSSSDKTARKTVSSSTSVPGEWSQISASREKFSQAGSGSWAAIWGIGISIQQSSSSLGAATFDFDDLRIQDQVGLLGDYQIRYTLLNNETGNEGNPNPTPLTALEVQREAIRITNLPSAAAIDALDSQVTHVRVYRTVGGGTAFFKEVEVPKGTTTVELVAADNEAMITNPADSTLDFDHPLQFDNDPPEDTYELAVIHAGRVFWSGDTAAGNQDRIYYSPTARFEAVQGFVLIAGDIVRALVSHLGQLWVFGERRIYSVQGQDEPFLVTPTGATPGTQIGNAVVPTPYGIFYWGTDGPHLFDGSFSHKIGDALEPIFLGQSVGAITPFTPTVGVFYEGEVWWSDGSFSFCYDIERKLWREHGTGYSTFHVEEDTGVLLGAQAGQVVSLLDESTNLDNAASIVLAWRTPEIIIPEGRVGILQAVEIDVTPSDGTVIVIIITDGTSTQLGQIPGNVRVVRRFTQARAFRRLAVEIAGATAGTGPIEVHSVRALIAGA